MNELRVRRTHQGYTVDFAAHANAADVQDLFGTTQLPLPWGPWALTEAVLADVAKRNPGADVVFWQD